jgi:hypothetical protein
MIYDLRNMSIPIALAWHSNKSLQASPIHGRGRGIVSVVVAQWSQGCFHPSKAAPSFFARYINYCRNKELSTRPSKHSFTTPKPRPIYVTYEKPHASSQCGCSESVKWPSRVDVDWVFARHGCFYFILWLERTECDNRTEHSGGRELTCGLGTPIEVCFLYIEVVNHEGTNASESSQATSRDILAPIYLLSASLAVRNNRQACRTNSYALWHYEPIVF